MKKTTLERYGKNIQLFDFELSVPTTSQNSPAFSRLTTSEDTPLHRHSYIEFFYVLEGSGTHILNGEKQTLTRGDAYLLHPNDIHGFPQLDETLFRHTDIGIKTNYFRELCDCLSSGLFDEFYNGNSLYFKLSSEQIAKLEHYIPHLYLCPTDEKNLLSAKAITLTITLLLLENRLVEKSDIPSWVLQLLTILNSHENFKTDISVLTSSFSYNADYMRRQFKKHIGMTMTDYFNRQKMDYAYKLLSTTNASIETICEMVGFNSVSYFRDLFKRIFNTTPGEIQKL